MTPKEFKEFKAKCGGLSQREMSELFGIPRPTINAWEQGARIITPLKAEYLKLKAEKLGLLN